MLFAHSIAPISSWLGWDESELVSTQWEINDENFFLQKFRLEKEDKFYFFFFVYLFIYF